MAKAWCAFCTPRTMLQKPYEKVVKSMDMEAGLHHWRIVRLSGGGGGL